MEKCPICPKEFKNTKALGSHLHYIHKKDRRSQVKIEFVIEPFWTPCGLVIECPSRAARDFVKVILDTEVITLKLKEKKHSFKKTQ